MQQRHNAFVETRGRGVAEKYIHMCAFVFGPLVNISGSTQQIKGARENRCGRGTLEKKREEENEARG